MRAALGLLIAAGLLHGQDATGSITGVVQDIVAHPWGAKVALGGAAGAERVAGPDGAFRFSGLTSGAYTLTLRVLGFASTEIYLTLGTGERVELPPITLDIAACPEPLPRPEFLSPLKPGTPTGRISGIVHADSSFLPATGAEVTVCRIEGGYCRTTRSTPEGKFEIDDLPSGFYTAKAALGGFQTITRGFVIVDAGWESIYKLELARSLKSGLCE